MQTNYRTLWEYVACNDIHIFNLLLLFVTAQYEKTIKRAIKEWKTYTCLKFKKANENNFGKFGHRNYVNFVGVTVG